MPYRLILDMNPTDFAVSRCVDELSKSRDVFTQDDIAALIGAHRTTVNKSIQRLIAAHIIQAERDGRYVRYEFVGQRAS